MTQGLNPLLTGLMLVNLAVSAFMLYVGITVYDYLFGFVDLLSLVGFLVVATALFVVLLVLGSKKIVQDKSQIKALGRRKYFAVALSFVAFFMLGFSQAFPSFTYFGSIWFNSFFGIFLMLEILSIVYYVDISKPKDTQNQIFNPPA